MNFHKKIAPLALICLCLCLIALPIAQAHALTFTHTSTSDSVVSYDECERKTAQKVSYACETADKEQLALGFRLGIYAVRSGACPDTRPETDIIELLPMDDIASDTKCSGTVIISPSDVLGGDGCPCDEEASLRLCAYAERKTIKYDNYGQQVLDWEADPAKSLTITYDSKPPTAPEITKVVPGDKSIYLSFSGAADIDAWLVCVEPLGEEEAVDEVVEELSSLVQHATQRALTKSDEEEGGGAPEEETGDAGVIDDEGDAGALGTEGDAGDTEDTGDAGDVEGAGEGEGEDCKAMRSPFEACPRVVTFSADEGARGVVQGLTNNIPYRLTLAGRDKAGNHSTISGPVEGTPAEVLDFFEAYVAAGGSEEGGFGCSSTAGTTRGAFALGLTGLAIALGACLRRRKRRNGSGGGRTSHKTLSSFVILGLGTGLGLVAVAPGASAASSKDFTASFETRPESPRNWELELNGTFFTPRIDDEKGLDGSPYETIFGKKRLWLFEAELDYQIADYQGPLGIGLGAGYGWVTGKGIYQETGESSPDATSLNIVPLRLMAVYRLQFFQRQGIPLIPFAKAGLAYTFWWSDEADGKLSQVDDRKARGGKWGYTLAIGLALSLGFIEPQMARDFDRSWGINDAHLLFQFVHTTADNFGGKGFDLSRDSLHIGLGFEM
ncbi:MAG: hypothetical protein LBM75_07100 [Myxococcales bacterium]|nr:hypothetical protein [Myxococcales bacterium]